MAILLMVVLVGLMLSALLVPMIITQSRTHPVRQHPGAGPERRAIRYRRDAGGDQGQRDQRHRRQQPASVRTRVRHGGRHRRRRLLGGCRVLHLRSGDRANPSDRAMKCVAGYGTFDAQQVPPRPVSRGSPPPEPNAAATDGSSNGTDTDLDVRLPHTSNVNILGGLLQIAPTGSAALCMDAGSPTAPAGTRGHAAAVQCEHTACRHNRYSPIGPTSPCNCCPDHCGATPRVCA